MNRNKRALYLCCIADPWVAVAKQLHQEIGLQPAYFVYWGSDEVKFKNQFDESCYFQKIEDAWKGIGFPKGLKPKSLDESEFKKIAWYELNALKMMDRLDPLGNDFGFQQRRYFFQDLLGYWLAYIDDQGLDIVISPSIPHRVFDYALYVACQMRSIKFLMFQMVPFGSNSLIIDSVDCMGVRYRFRDYSSVDLMPSSHIVDRIGRVKRDYDKAVPDYMLKHEQRARFNLLKSGQIAAKIFIKSILSLFGYSRPNTYWVEKGKMPAESCYGWLEYYQTRLSRWLRVKQFRSKYHDILSVGLPTKYVLVALHYQPEETSCPTGGSYADQISMVRLLDQALPADISILVKEHKSQFYSHQESSSGRDNSYYQRLKSISDRVFFADVDHSPFSLIDQATATVTISGTIGWESAIRGTPTLLFGRAWYEYMPRVYKVKTKLDVVGFWDAILSEKNKNLEKEIYSFHASLESKFVRAKHYKAFLGKDDVTMSESVVNLTSAIKGFLSGQ